MMSSSRLMSTTKCITLLLFILVVNQSLKASAYNRDSILVDSLFSIVYSQVYSAPEQKLIETLDAIDSIARSLHRAGLQYNIHQWRMTTFYYNDNWPQVEHEFSKMDSLLLLDTAKKTIHYSRYIDLNLSKASYFINIKKQSIQGIKSLRNAFKAIELVEKRDSYFNYNYKRCYAMLGQLNFKLGRYEEGLKVYDDIIGFEKNLAQEEKRKPSHYSFDARKGAILIKLKRYQEAYDLLKNSLERYEQDLKSNEALKRPYFRHVGRMYLDLYKACNALSKNFEATSVSSKLLSYLHPDYEYEYHLEKANTDTANYNFHFNNAIHSKDTVQRVQAFLILNDQFKKLDSSVSLAKKEVLSKLLDQSNLIVHQESTSLSLDLRFLKEYGSLVSELASEKFDNKEYESLRNSFVSLSNQLVAGANLSSLSFELKLTSAEALSNIYDLAIHLAILENDFQKTINLHKQSSSIASNSKHFEKLRPEDAKLPYDILNITDLKSNHLNQEFLTKRKEELIYVDYILKNDQFFALVDDEFSERIIRLGTRSEIAQEVNSFLKKTKLKEKISDSAFNLFEILVAPLNLPQTGSLNISAQGVLALLPFNALMSQQNSSNSFLINVYNISYEAGIMKREQPANSKKTIGLFAPIFTGGACAQRANGSRSTNYLLDPLPFAREEVKELGVIWSTDLTNSSKKALLEAFEICSIVHFAGHTLIDDNSIDHQLVLNADYNKKSNTLSLTEISRSSCNNELVVLSACNSGVGKFFPGEGVLSLSKGLIYSGASSVVSTLWSINDQSSARIMKDFHAGLKDGLNKDEALRKAQLAYLKNADPEYQHPYYWAAFIPTGDMKPLFGRSHFFGFYIVSGLLLVIALFVYKRRASGNFI